MHDVISMRANADTVVDVTQYGAVGDGKTNNTAAFRKGATKD